MGHVTGQGPADPADDGRGDEPGGANGREHHGREGRDGREDRREGPEGRVEHDAGDGREGGVGQDAGDGRDAGQGTEPESGAGEGRPQGGSGEERRGGSGGRRGPSRRTLLIAGGTAVGLAAVGAGLHQDLSRWWWRMPGNTQPREEGDVDDPRAEWIPAAQGNWRLANRPDDYTIDRVIVHVTQGSYASAVKVFRDPQHRAAAHYIVRQDGRLTQMIRELDIAFHAGNREYNERSVGIEHEGWINRPSDFTESMYRTSAKLTAGICARYGFPADREHIIGHVEVPRATHHDPGPNWDWDHYMSLVRGQLKRMATGTRQQDTDGRSR